MPNQPPTGLLYHVRMECMQVIEACNPVTIKGYPNTKRRRRDTFIVFTYASRPLISGIGSCSDLMVELYT